VNPDPQEVMGFIWVVSALLGLVFKLWVTSGACGFFVRARQAGLLELLLVASITPRQIVWGQWWALRRAFLWMALVLVVMQLGAGWMQIETIKASVAKTAATTGTNANFDLTPYYVSLLMQPLEFLTGLLALVWFGMWMGLTSGKTNVAVIKTIVFCQVLPSIALTFLQWMAMFGIAWGGSVNLHWVPEAAGSVLGMGVDFVFVMVAQRKLLGRFRDVVTQSPGYLTAPKPPPLSAAAPVPPPVPVS
jgi:hypothetical protein